MKKILVSIMIIAVVAAIAVGGTVAYFATDGAPAQAQVSTATVTLNSLLPNQDGLIINAANVIPGQAIPQGWLAVINNSSDSVALDVTLNGAIVDGPSELTNALNVVIKNAVTSAVLYTGSMSGLQGAAVAAGTLAQGASFKFTVDVSFPSIGDQTALQGKAATLTLTPHGQTTP